jgi:peptidoglycan/LPS O-acetylase OafA/YrhL
MVRISDEVRTIAEPIRPSRGILPKRQLSNPGRLWVSDRQKPHFAYIECVRGYAVLLVIMCHTTYLFPELPYPVHRVTVLGWHGVQLFYLASAVTLMMSWQYEKSRDGGVDVVAFFMRRFFRIAPAYYLASILYFWLEPPAGGFDLAQAAATYSFINAWHPALMGVTPHAWSVVPGSWSIGVEFTFYAVFPILACTITSLARAMYLLLGTVLFGAALNWWLWPGLDVTIGDIPADNFLYFWFPNQMSVFALGLCLFHLLQRDHSRRSVLGAYPALIATLSVAAVASIGFIALPHWLNLREPLPPAFLVASVAMMVFVLALARSEPGLFLNKPVALMGRVSFSAYLLHVAVLDVVSEQPFLQKFLHVSGWPAVVAFGIGLLCIILIVLAGSWCTYSIIENPMIGAGKLLIRRRRLAIS